MALRRITHRGAVAVVVGPYDTGGRSGWPAAVCALAAQAPRSGGHPPMAIIDSPAYIAGSRSPYTYLFQLTRQLLHHYIRLCINAFLDNGRSTPQN